MLVLANRIIKCFIARFVKVEEFYSNKVMATKAEIQIGEWCSGYKCECENEIFEWHEFIGKPYRVCTKCGRQYEIKGKANKVSHEKSNYNNNKNRH